MPFLAEGRCMDPRINVIYGIIVGGYSGIMDLILSALPWKVLKDVQINQQEKTAVILTMNLGIVRVSPLQTLLPPVQFNQGPRSPVTNLYSAGIAAFVKCSYIPTLIHGDFSYNGAQLVIWGGAESAVVIMATSIPVMRPLVRDAASSIWKHVAPKKRQQQPESLPPDQEIAAMTVSTRAVDQALRA
ncbi:hypothetical protein MAPG_09198 [Magnaporthiopsis poae ATCC 64411]|uniref:Rhodopsin domain-containing protein n=1 Tax=Magnaporthiopsis poae (strain ATCC 64411 / 73-15) TaxID=644358 RepID=A0A0C4E9B8_MAGP6|nr:hypothetical protein MAPG_09198 [Magnaporthiopsis poae ATCC 64411]